MSRAPGSCILARILAAALYVAAPALHAQSGPIETFHVQGKVWLLAGSTANVAVQIGNDGILVVDPGGAATSDAVLAAIRTLSDKPIRWIINTHEHADHTGANATLSAAGETVNGNPAAIVAHENVLGRMAMSDRPVPEWPLNTFFESQRDFYFNGEAVFLYHIPNAHTDGDILVHFRGSDVLVTGDLFVTTHFPIIDLAMDGNVDGVVAGLNKTLDITVPAFLQEGGTYVIPGHGRIADEADVVSYRDMLLFVRDRIRHLRDEGMSLAEVQAAEPALDYASRYNNTAIPWTTAQFVESVYRSLED
jgi:glyoxylase-like metal-dependent hydrolase (beta-lactamase superfamily II)